MDRTAKDTSQQLHAPLQNKNFRTAALAVACTLLVAVVIIVLTALPRQDSHIEEVQIDTVPATIRADHVPALSVKLSRGDLVDIVDEKDGYYLVEYGGESDANALHAGASADSSASESSDADPAEPADASVQKTENGALISKQSTARIYIDKRYVRQPEQSAPEQRTGYVLSPASLFATAMLTGSHLAELEQNTEVTVLDEFAGCLFIELSDKTRGYISAKAVGDAPVEETPEPEQSWEGDAGSTYYSPQYYDGGGGSQTGGWQGGDIDLGGEATGSDGGDIVLTDPTAASYAANALKAEAPCVPFIAQAYADEPPAAHAMVLSDGLQAYLDWFDRGEVINIVDTSCLSEEDSSLIPENTSVVVMDDQWGLIDNNLIKLEGDKDYEPWEGFTSPNAGLFSTYTLQGEPRILDINQNVTVIDDLSTCYVVMFGEQLGYMAKNEVSATPYEEPEPEESIDYGNDFSYYGGGYYDYGYDTSSPPVDAGNTGSSVEVIENTIGGWTDEKL